MTPHIIGICFIANFVKKGDVLPLLVGSTLNVLNTCLSEHPTYYFYYY